MGRACESGATAPGLCTFDVTRFLNPSAHAPLQVPTVSVRACHHLWPYMCCSAPESVFMASPPFKAVRWCSGVPPRLRDHAVSMWFREAPKPIAADSEI